MAIINGMYPIHSGEILREEFLIPMNLNAHALAMALRLVRYFGTSAEFWLDLQADFDLKTASMFALRQRTRQRRSPPFRQARVSLRLLHARSTDVRFQRRYCEVEP